MTPLGQSDGAVELEIVSVVERALLVEMVADGGMNGGELLQTSHATEPLHCSLSSSEREMRILRPIVEPAASFVAVGIADILHRSGCCQNNENSHRIAGAGAVRRMRTRIGFLAQPEPMRSIVGATQ